MSNWKVMSKPSFDNQSFLTCSQSLCNVLYSANEFQVIIKEE